MQESTHAVHLNCSNRRRSNTTVFCLIAVATGIRHTSCGCNSRCCHCKKLVQHSTIHKTQTQLTTQGQHSLQQQPQQQCLKRHNHHHPHHYQQQQFQLLKITFFQQKSNFRTSPISSSDYQNSRRLKHSRQSHSSPARIRRPLLLLPPASSKCLRSNP